MDTDLYRLSTEQGSALTGTFPGPGARFSHVHLYFVGLLLLSNGCSYLLTYVDRFAWWPEATPSLTLLLQRWSRLFSVVGLPSSMRHPLSRPTAVPSLRLTSSSLSSPFVLYPHPDDSLSRVCQGDGRAVLPPVENLHEPRRIGQTVLPWSSWASALLSSRTLTVPPLNWSLATQTDFLVR
nr:unnamed protein product [Spirometra erinaceieuropaei]